MSSLTRPAFKRGPTYLSRVDLGDSAGSFCFSLGLVVDVADDLLALAEVLDLRGGGARGFLVSLPEATSSEELA